MISRFLVVLAKSFLIIVGWVLKDEAVWLWRCDNWGSMHNSSNLISNDWTKCLILDVVNRWVHTFS
jgi:hypothetical protein